MKPEDGVVLITSNHNLQSFCVYNPGIPVDCIEYNIICPCMDVYNKSALQGMQAWYA